MTKEAISTLEDLNKVKDLGLKSMYPGKLKIMVGTATCGVASGAEKVYDAIVSEVESRNLDAEVTRTGCLGFCQKEPLVDVFEVGKPRVTYAEVTPKKVKDLMEAIANEKVVKEWLLTKMEEEEFLLDDTNKKHSDDNLPKEVKEELKDVPSYNELPFFKKQQKIALRNCGFIDSDNIDEYIARGGYYALQKVIENLSPEEVIEDVTKAGIRGRGGAGFPTGLKWKFAREAEGSPKYVICNADEGDPGAYMDRCVLEGDPHSVLEGMIIGAYAIGASEGYLYVRTEYPLAIEKLKRAIEQAEEYGLLGENIFGSGFSFELKIAQGSGSFVCGEETSLMASIEGRPPEPQIRPPFPATSGLWGKPSNINNVETWATIPVILKMGSEWYSKIGTEKSKGTKVFSLVGAINNTGLVEIPMGIPLREIIHEIGGGIIDDKALKGVQTGGPSGGCIPAEMIDISVDYEKLSEAGSIIGSGGMIVMDETACMVDVAKFFLDFTVDESCGRCNSCRDGLSAMHEVLTRISEGKGRETDIDFLKELSEAIKDFSLCALGGTAPNPVLTTLKYFEDEYKAHIFDKTCPAKVCKELIEYSISKENCTGCMLCRKRCPVEAITGEKKQLHVIDPEKCIKCGVCYDSCRFDAVEVN
jgi:NADH:ubiquinone oxidoreductase subunit F (NADH-binding)/(2Fe-2S) ferredoxin/ferredoxin